MPFRVWLVGETSATAPQNMSGISCSRPGVTSAQCYSMTWNGFSLGVTSATAPTNGFEISWYYAHRLILVDLY